MSEKNVLRQITILSIVGFFLILVAIIPSVNATSGSVSVPADESRSVDLGFLYTGTIVDYSWATDDEYDDVDFRIASGNDSYESTTETYSGSGTFSVPTDADYSMIWYCNNWMDSAEVDYTFTITDPTVDADLTVSYNFSKNPCPQGEESTVSISIKNPNDDQIKITDVGIHFDWQPTDIYVIDDGIQSNPPTLATAASHSSSITFSVQSDVSLGMHTYDILINYEIKAYGNWHEKTWESGDKLDFSVSAKDRDGDGTPDTEDAFPDNPDETKDTDEDGIGDNQDDFPSDPLEHTDTDNDGVGDNADEFPENGNETIDTDKDGIGDNADKFPNDIAASVDSDGDGYPDEWNTGKTEKDSTSGLKLDAYPTDAEKFEKKEDSPGIGIIGILLTIAVMVLFFKINKD